MARVVTDSSALILLASVNPETVFLDVILRSKATKNLIVFKPIQPATEARLSKECQQGILFILRQWLICKSDFCEIKRE